jgi:hypothetical protein
MHGSKPYVHQLGVTVAWITIVAAAAMLLVARRF